MKNLNAIVLLLFFAFGFGAKEIMAFNTSEIDGKTRYVSKKSRRIDHIGHDKTSFYSSHTFKIKKTPFDVLNPS